MSNRITGCGEGLGEGRRGLITERGVRPRGVEILHPFRDGAAGMVEAKEEALVQEFIAHPPVDGEDGPAPDKGPYTGPTLQKGAFR